MQKLNKFKLPTTIKLSQDCFNDLRIYSKYQMRLYISKISEHISANLLQTIKPKQFIDEGSFAIRIGINCPIYISGDIAHLLSNGFCLEKQLGSSLLSYCAVPFNINNEYLPVDVI
ncbi:hypothetical protein FDH01_gp239 [Acinetobacter phage vB_AbaM_ME3]|uniref:Uncharacterized protein n=1 Tax=Acinetobacter phage vB_AbaM_ME3 TaxID=1837876 RepID=A0A172Q0R8_9CAUD|nr:hypothetical protein FDH01_gp239 [Acinetobacter phage vB_AbaM_ME3]AND75383.1 hypothetical protein ME3_222 [Acinetobacter phage vB_AbaM_ME3]